jgi:hypothetical protein
MSATRIEPAVRVAWLGKLLGMEHPPRHTEAAEVAVGDAHPMEFFDFDSELPRIHPRGLSKPICAQEHPQGDIQRFALVPDVESQASDLQLDNHCFAGECLKVQLGFSFAGVCTVWR